jgi:hypothetical protein
MLASFVQNGIKPQHIRESNHLGFSGCWRITGTLWVGALSYTAPDQRNREDNGSLPNPGAYSTTLWRYAMEEKVCFT